MLEGLIFPFQFSFMIKAFFIVIIVSPPAALLSCYLVLKGWALMGDAISHSVLPGIVLASIFGIPLIFGAFLSGFMCAILSGFLSLNSRVKADTLIGVVFSAMFALGLVLYTKLDTDIHLDHILFGNMLGLDFADIILSGVVSALVVTIILIKRVDFLIHCFDPIYGHVIGLKINALYYGLLTLLSLTIVSALSSVGMILSIGLLIIPGATAFLVTKQFEKMFVIAVTATIGSGLLGVFISFFLDSAPEPTIILILSGCFISSLIFYKAKTTTNLSNLQR